MRSFAIEIMSSPYFALITLLLGLLIGNRLAKERQTIHEVSFAAIKLRESFLPLIEILENSKFPPHFDNIQFNAERFASQEAALLGVKARLNRKSRDRLTQKWNEYKEKCEPYKTRSFTAYMQFHDDNKELLNLIHEILKIAEHN